MQMDVLFGCGRTDFVYKNVLDCFDKHVTFSWVPNKHPGMLIYLFNEKCLRLSEAERNIFRKMGSLLIHGMIDCSLKILTLPLHLHNS